MAYESIETIPADMLTDEDHGALARAAEESGAWAERARRFRLPSSIMTLSNETAPVGSAGDIAIVSINGTQRTTVL